MSFWTDIFSQVLGIGSALIPFVILLGVLVFIHELGHFMVARFCGVRVEVFSLGFGKKLLKWKKGDTTYCISLFPLGGYVKMFGHEYEKPVAEKDKPFAFLHKKLWQRTAIVAAGPLMNFFLAILLFAGLQMVVGESLIRPVVGELEPSSTLAKEGQLNYGDLILAIDEHPINSSKQAKELIFNKPNQTLKFKVKKANGTITTHQITTQKDSTTSRWGFTEMGGVVKGLSFFAPAPLVGVANPSSPAGRAGFKTFDKVLSINGKKITHKKDLFAHLSPTPNESGSPTTNRTSTTNEAGSASTWKVEVQRGSKTHLLTLKKPAEYRDLKQLGLIRSDLFISGLKKGGSAELAGLKKGDLIYKINGEVAKDWPFLVSKIQGFKKDQKPLQLEIKREGQKQLISLTPEIRTQIIAGVEKKEYMVGIMAQSPQIPAGELVTHKQTNPLKALVYGVNQTFYWSGLIGIYIKKMITGEISRKTLGGAVAIGRAAYDSYSHGLEHFIRLMAILSVQLFLLNILPIPLFDGGHLMLYAIEFFNGAPLSIKKTMIIQRAGAVFLLFLLIWTTFNDLHNWFFLW